MSSDRVRPAAVALVGLVALVALTTACSSPDSPPTSSPVPVSARPVVRVGDAPALRVEVADDEAERERGLMDRDDVPAGTGMLFRFDGDTTTPFYMYRTRVALSIAFIRDGEVVSTAEMAPCTAQDAGDCPLYRPAGAYRSAVEAPAGTFAGVRAGAPVTVSG